MLQRPGSVSAASGGLELIAVSRAALAATDPTASWTVPVTTMCPATAFPAAASVVPAITADSVNWVNSSSRISEETFASHI